MKGRNSKLKRKIYESFRRKLKESIKKSLNEGIDGSYEQILSSENLVVNECRYDDYDILILYFTFDDKYRAYVVSTYEGPALVASKEGFNDFQSAVDWAEIVMDNDSQNFEESVSKKSTKKVNKKVKESIKKSLSERYVDDWYYDLSKEEQEQVDHLLDIYYGRGTMLDDLESDECDELIDRFEMMKESRKKHESKKDKKNKMSCEDCDKTIKEGKLRPFNKEDWYAWAGAEDFEDSPPYIYEDPETGNTIIVSGNSGNSEAIVEVDIWKDDDQSVAFYREDYNSKEEALADAEDVIATGGLSGDLAYFDSRTGWVKNEMGI